jgi:hydroxymethylglutaryl-CoA synthase
MGLSQTALSFVGDREDAISMALTAITSLFNRFHISPTQIGRLEVASECGPDASKGIKTHIMPLFEAVGNYDIEGSDCIAACYGGTAAVLNAIHWVESRSWDGRYALVVATDISVYAPGPARPTSGAGAVALLIGPDAPLILEPELIATHMRHAYDFYKPSGPFPSVDGLLSVYSYLLALDACFERFKHKWQVSRKRALHLTDDVDFYAFHAPYNKLVMKAHARLLYLDAFDNNKHGSTINHNNNNKNDNNNNNNNNNINPVLAAFSDQSNPINVASSLIMQRDISHPFPPQSIPREVEKCLMNAASEHYQHCVLPSTAVQRQCGNMYTASVWSGLATLIEAEGSGLEGKRVLLYSYGSGLSASLLSFVGRKPTGGGNGGSGGSGGGNGDGNGVVAHGAKGYHNQANGNMTTTNTTTHKNFELAEQAIRGDIAIRLAQRQPRSCEEFEHSLQLAASRYGAAGYVPVLPSSIDSLPQGTFYLVEVDSRYRRTYAKR